MTIFADARCPVCHRRQRVSTGRLVTHQSGSRSCSGSGREAPRGTSVMDTAPYKVVREPDGSYVVVDTRVGSSLDPAACVARRTDRQAAHRKAKALARAL